MSPTHDGARVRPAGVAHGQRAVVRDHVLHLAVYDGAGQLIAVQVEHDALVGGDADAADRVRNERHGRVLARRGIHRFLHGCKGARAGRRHHAAGGHDLVPSVGRFGGRVPGGIEPFRHLAGERAAGNERVAGVLRAYERGNARRRHERAARDGGRGLFVDAAVAARVVVADADGGDAPFGLEVAAMDVALHLARLAGSVQGVERRGGSVRRAGDGLERAAVDLEVADGGGHGPLHARERAAVDDHMGSEAGVPDGVAPDGTAQAARGAGEVSAVDDGLPFIVQGARRRVEGAVVDDEAGRRSGVAHRRAARGRGAAEGAVLYGERALVVDGAVAAGGRRRRVDGTLAGDGQGALVRERTAGEAFGTRDAIAVHVQDDVLAGRDGDHFLAVHHDVAHQPHRGLHAVGNGGDRLGKGRERLVADLRDLRPVARVQRHHVVVGSRLAA